MMEPAMTVFGIDSTSNDPVRINQEGRRQGVYIIGATGTGKSTLLERMILADIERGIGALVLDIHGRLCEAVLDKLSLAAAERCYCVDMTDPTYSFGLNLFECPDPSQASVVADRAVTLFHKIWADQWGQTIQTILFNTAYVFASLGDLTLVEVPRFLRDDAFRERLIENLPELHPVRDFWAYDYRTTADRGSTVRRVQEFLSSDTLYPVVAQSTSTLPFRTLMDDGITLLVTLDRRQERASELVGALLLSQVFEAALSRLVDLSEEECYARQYHLYCDEYDRFCSPQFAEMMREVRKCGLGITVAHQDRDKLDSANRAATLQMGTQIVFRAGVDASELARYLPRPTELGDPTQRRKMEPVYNTWTETRWADPDDEASYAAAGQRIQEITRRLEEYAANGPAYGAIDAFGKTGLAHTVNNKLWRAVTDESIIDFVKRHGRSEMTEIHFGEIRQVIYTLDLASLFDIPVRFSPDGLVAACEAEQAWMFGLLTAEEQAELRTILLRLFSEHLAPRMFHYTRVFRPGASRPERLIYGTQTGELILQMAFSRSGIGQLFFQDGGTFDPVTFPPNRLMPLRQFCDRVLERYPYEPDQLDALGAERDALRGQQQILLDRKITETYQEYLWDVPVYSPHGSAGRQVPAYEMVREPRQLTQTEFAQRLSSLPDRTAWAKLVDGTSCHLHTLPPGPQTSVDRVTIAERSRARFCHTRREVQAEIEQRQRGGASSRLPDDDQSRPPRVQNREPLTDPDER